MYQIHVFFDKDSLKGGNFVIFAGICKKMRLKNVLTILLFFLPVLLCAQPRPQRFRFVTDQKDFTIRHSRQIVQDNQGYIWIASNTGLVKYDSYTFTTYRNKPGDSSSLIHDDVLAVFQDSRNTLWIGTRSGLCRYDPLTNSFFQYPRHAAGGKTITNPLVNVIFEDSKGNLWFGNWDGVDRYDYKSETFKNTAFTAKGSHFRNNVTAIGEDRKGNLWIGTQGGGLFRKDADSDKYTAFLNNPLQKGSLSSNTVTSIAFGSDGTLWVGTWRGLNRFVQSSNSFVHYFYDPENSNSVSHNQINSVLVDSNGNLWIGTEEGLDFFDPQRERFYNYKENFDGKNSIRVVHALYEDRAKGVWASTSPSGVIYIDIAPIHFTNYQFEKGESNSLTNNYVTALIEDEPGSLWVGTEGALNHFQEQSGLFTAYRHRANSPSSLSNNNVTCLTKTSEGRLWIGTEAGLNLLLPDKTFRRFLFDSLALASTAHFEIQCMAKDPLDRLWISTTAPGLVTLDPRTGKSSYFSPDSGLKWLSRSSLSFFACDTSGTLWIPAGNNITLKDLNTEISRKLLSEEQAAENPLHWINHIMWDRQYVWIASAGGIWQYDRKSKQISLKVASDENEGIAFYRIEKDRQGNLWISTSNGLIRYHPPSGRTVTYYPEDGLPSEQFTKASCITSDGRLVFGSVAGFTVFRPEEIVKQHFVSNLVLTDIRVFNESLIEGRNRFEQQGAMPDMIRDGEKLTHVKLAYNQSVVAFDFALLDYRSDDKKYAYRLEGFDKDWNLIEKKHTATYTSLPPGNYTLHIRAASYDRLWQEEGIQLKITVMQPYWRTWWAYIIYVGVTIFFILIFRRILIARERLRSEVAYQQFEREKTEELNLMKLRFFTNISHEFKTPLTLIIGPLEKLIGTPDLEQQVREQVLLIHRNARRLLRLINQLMDLRKIDSRQLKLSLSQGDLVGFLAEVAHSFDMLARQRRIAYHFESACDSLGCAFDSDKIEKIVFNLLSNAFKFTPDEGSVSLEVRVLPTCDAPEFIEVVVTDTGRGIPQNEIEHIFERFYQVSKEDAERAGTGIGLALTRELVEIHQGNIKAESTPGQQTAFTVRLPYMAPENASDPVKMPKNEPIDLPAYSLPLAEREAAEKAETILVVDDNDDMRAFIRNTLSDHFEIIEAEDGEKGLEYAISHMPALIVSDVMMPRMDGITFCDKVKTDSIISHIPVILLTAKTGVESQTKGYLAGADDYVTKPFNAELLKIRAKNLIDSRTRLRQRFSRELNIEPSEITVTPIDEEILRKAIDVVEKHIEDPEFGVEGFVAEMGMSRSQLYIKMKAITNQPVSEFIKTIRLKRAAQLLKTRQMNVSEVAYKVGFNDAKYFSKCFKSAFGHLPSEFARIE